MITDTQKANCLRLAGLIEASDTFGMSRIYHECGSPACVIGHIEKHFLDGADYRREVVRDKFGMSIEQQDALFTPDQFNGQSVDWRQDTLLNTHAAATIRQFVEKGVMQW